MKDIIEIQGIKLTPDAIISIKDFQDDTEWVFTELANMRRRLIDLSFHHDEVDFMSHLRSIQTLEDFFKELSNT